jgi:hypothetical protein
MLYSFVCDEWMTPNTNGDRQEKEWITEGTDLWEARAALRGWIDATGRSGCWIKTARPEPIDELVTIWRDKDGAEYCLDDDGVWQMCDGKWERVIIGERDFARLCVAGMLTC